MERSGSRGSLYTVRFRPIVSPIINHLGYCTNSSTGSPAGSSLLMDSLRFASRTTHQYQFSKWTAICRGVLGYGRPKVHPRLAKSLRHTQPTSHFHRWETWSPSSSRHKTRSRYHGVSQYLWSTFLFWFTVRWRLSLIKRYPADNIIAINSLAFQTRAGLLRYLSVDKIRRASANWKRIWDSVTGLLVKDQFFHIGYPKHAQELWWLLNATLEVSSKSDASFKYLDNTATDDLGNLNDFIQWCYEIAPWMY